MRVAQPMAAPPKPAAIVRWSWLPVLVVCLVAIFSVNRARLARIDYLTNQPEWSGVSPEPDASSPTGYEKGLRKTIAPDRRSPGIHWTIQTQLMHTRGDWRMQHVDYDNAPQGRLSRGAEPYRWWLVFVAWLDRHFTGRSWPVAIEHGVLYADALLQGLLVAGTVCYVARKLGAFSAVTVALALTVWFPFAANFQAGSPDHHELAWALVLWSILPLAILFCAPRAADNNRTPFVFAGVAGGLLLWTDPAVGLPVLAGIALGGLAQILLSANGNEINLATSWRAWGWAGAVIAILACLCEYRPGGFSWRPNDSIHPLHAFAWLGAAECLTLLERWRRAGRDALTVRSLIVGVAALAALVSLPIALLTSPGQAAAGPDILAAEVARIPDPVGAINFGAWLHRDGFSLALCATILPALGVLVAAALLIFRRATTRNLPALALAVGPLLVALGCATFHLRWWNAVDATAACVLIVIVCIFESSIASGSKKWLGIGGFALSLIPGLLLVRPWPAAAPDRALNSDEIQAVVERDLAHWLVREAGDENPVVLTTPDLSDALAYFGSVRVVASGAPENDAGFSGASRIMSASLRTEAAALVAHRTITRLILPSWDPTFEELVRLDRRVPAGGKLPANSLLGWLRHWDVPPWLRPVAYHLPENSGFEAFRLTAFAVDDEVDEEVDEETAWCRLADYFVEMKMTDFARSVRTQLQQYPRSLPALITLAEVNQSIGETAEFRSNMDSIQPQLSRRAARSLPLDRRITLAALLVQTGQKDAGREQMQQVLPQVDAAHIRALPLSARVRLLVLSNYYKLDFPDPELRRLTLSLLPPFLRAKIDPTGS